MNRNTKPTFLLLAAAALANAALAQADAAETEIRPGPAIAYEDAFPAQEPFDRPLLVEFHPTDREMAYVVTQPGHVFRVPRDGSRGDREVFLDFSDRVYLKNWEEGLLGFDFDPDYESNGFVWVCWSEETEQREGVMAGGRKHASNRQSVISRLTVDRSRDAPVVDLDSELRVMEVFQPWGNHNGGTILFGPDGMLYVALGDGGKANDPYGNSESLENLLGKVLRVDVRGATVEKPYAIPPDNPFAGRDDARGEIWCYGLRNVWRMAFDRETGELWAADVGQNRIEEVVLLQKGGFYGWNTFEGTERFALRRSRRPTPADHIPPVVEYTHRDGLSITGGHVYRGERIPGLRGFYVYADFMTRRAWACRAAGGDPEGAGPEVVTLAHVPHQPSSFAEEPEGELLVTCFLGKQGKIYRLVPAD